jgi:S1-C subfamily serine protease
VASIGSGFAVDIKRKRFVTNAHCVEDAVVVQVREALS